MRYLITGGAGYFGSVLKNALLADNHECVSIDIVNDIDTHPNLISCRVDVTDKTQLERLFLEKGPFDAVFHCAAQLTIKKNQHDYFDRTNINSTQYLADLCVGHNTKHFIFISSNCVYGKVNNTLISENHPLDAFERYGLSKVASEKILENYTDKMHVIIFRPPTIIGQGRLGILSLVYDFIKENKKLWLIGSGHNRYQFVSGHDLAEACKKAVLAKKSGIYNIGTEAVPTLNHVFMDLIRYANSQSRLIHFPEKTGIFLLKMAYKLGLSPLAPYSYSMISSTYTGDITKIKSDLGWEPSCTNSEMLMTGYQYYINHYDEIHDKKNTLPGHRKAGSGGILQLVKWFS